MKRIGRLYVMSWQSLLALAVRPCDGPKGDCSACSALSELKRIYGSKGRK